jgi:diaminobutyrate-2-oxoglutarate transaminase
MAAGAATIRHVVAERLAERAADLGVRMRVDLAGLVTGDGIVGDVRGRGLMLGIEIVDPAAAPDPLGARVAAPALAKRVRAECLARGLIVELGGRHGAVVRLLPPLTLTDAEAGQALDIIGAALRAAERSGYDSAR